MDATADRGRDHSIPAGCFRAVVRGKRAGEEGPVDAAEFGSVFAQLGWKPLPNAVKYLSPREGDGGGATYYYDEQAGIAYQITGYW